MGKPKGKKKVPELNENVIIERDYSKGIYTRFTEEFPPELASRVCAVMCLVLTLVNNLPLFF